MWKLVKSTNANHLFKTGDKIRVRSGNHVSYYLELVLLANNKHQWQETTSDSGMYFGWSREDMTRGDMSEMGDFYGRTIDLWAESIFDKEEEEEVTSNVKEVPPNTLVLVGKSFTKLVDGLHLVFKPYKETYGAETTAVVSRHSMGNGRGAECIQVHLQRKGKSYSTISFSTDLDNKTVADLTYFAKYSCYLVKNYQKAEPKANKSVIVAPPAPKVQKKDVGKFIVWCPSSNLPPRVVHDTESQAKAVAASMSERHDKEFYWAELKGRAEQQVTQKQVVKVVTTRTTVFA